MVRRRCGSLFVNDKQAVAQLWSCALMQRSGMRNRGGVNDLNINSSPKTLPVMVACVISVSCHRLSLRNKTVVNRHGTINWFKKPSITCVDRNVCLFLINYCSRPQLASTRTQHDGKSRSLCHSKCVPVGKIHCFMEERIENRAMWTWFFL